MILNRIRVAIAVLCLLAWPAQAQKTPAQIRTDINTLFPDNDQNRITPFDLRFVTTEITSAYLPVTSVIPSANIPPATNGGLGGVFAIACASNLWIQTITTGTGSPVCTQINFSNLAGSASAAQLGSSPASHATVIDVAGSPTWSVVPNCLDSVGQHVNYTQSTDVWSCGTSTNAGPGVGSVDNLLQNNQWRLWAGVTWVTTQNPAGTADETIPTCASFTTTTQAPVFTCANTQQLKAGDLIIVSNDVPFWGFANAGYVTCVQVQCTSGFVTSAKIGAITPNTSVTLNTPGFGGVSPVASISTTLAPITPGDAGVTTSGPDGWTKTGSLHVTVDTWGASATPASTVYPGCERPLLVRKGITGVETMFRSVPASQLGTYQGRVETFGAAVYQRIQGGGSTWNLAITDSTGTTSGTNGTGAGLGGYQFLPVTRTIAQAATSSAEVFSFNGNIGDVFDVCLPTAAFIPSMVESQLKTNSFEITLADSHFNPPLTTPFIIAFPTTPVGGVATTLYGYNTNDFEALSFGTEHNAGHVYGKLEWRTTSTWLGCNIFFGGFINTVNGALVFGLQAVGQVANIVFPTPIVAVPLYHVGGTVSLYTDCNNSTGVLGIGTFDFTNIDNNGPTSFQ